MDRNKKREGEGGLGPQLCNRKTTEKLNPFIFAQLFLLVQSRRPMEERYIPINRLQMAKQVHETEVQDFIVIVDGVDLIRLDKVWSVAG